MYVQKDSSLHFVETICKYVKGKEVSYSGFYYALVLQREQQCQVDLKPANGSRECCVFVKDSKGQNHVSYLSEQVDGGVVLLFL